MPLIPALEAALCEFKVNLIYKVSFRTVAEVTQKNPVLGLVRWLSG